MLSQTAEYAMRAMTWLSLTPDQLLPTSELARHTKIPMHYLAKVLQQLSAARLVSGRRGVGGGYRLARPADKINLTEVIAAVATISRIHTCPLGLPNHGTNLCPLHRTMDNAIKAVLEIWEGKTLADLLNDSKDSKPLCNAELTAKLTVSAIGRG
ncbi:MAG: Rrf2 family transcriptional regulator [Phycisphaerae bacterium]|nr:Rrf2 family transcriptional regulator [Phycisphaerae bacterium]